jgi:hypothetical protein
MQINSNGERFERTTMEENSIKRLRDIHMNLIPDLGENWNQHSLVTLRRQSLSRILYYDWIYNKLLGKPGVICEFGVQWGSALSLLQNLRAVYEPYNYRRKIFGFDTFTGFSNISNDDSKLINKGDYKVSKNYEAILQEILQIHDDQSPVSHIDKTFLIKGDVSDTVTTWLDNFKGVAIGLAIFDMDIYKPTKDVLLAIKPRLFKGSLLVFDEFSCAEWAGETIAVDEVFGLGNLKFESFPNQPNCAVCVVE